MDPADRWLALALTAIVSLALFLFFASLAHSRDLGQWEDHSPEIRAWFQSLRQPDRPEMPCCGEADGYWCDNVHIRDHRTYCTITDDRDDEPLKRPHIPLGTEIMIPDHKLGNYPGNPTGHNIVFVGVHRGLAGELDYSQGDLVYCYVQGGGI